MPVPCFDGVLTDGKRVYLFKRAIGPGKGRWWLMGGRILKGETFQEAIKRKAKEELGVPVKIIRQIGVYEIFESEGKPGVTSGTHCIAVDFVIKPKTKTFRFKLNDEYASGRWKIMTAIPSSLHPYVKQVLKDSKVFKKGRIKG